MKIPPRTPKEREHERQIKYKKRRAGISQSDPDTSEELGGSDEDRKRRSKLKNKEPKGDKKRSSMHEHLVNYTEQLENVLYREWLERLSSRWPLAHVGK